MVLHDYKSIYPIDLPWTWYATAAGLLLNGLYSFNLLGNILWVPYDPVEKIVPFAISLLLLGAQTYQEIMPFWTGGNWVQFAIGAYDKLLIPLMMVIQIGIPVFFPGSIPSKYY